MRFNDLTVAGSKSVIMEAIHDHDVVLVKAPTGSGKTLGIPAWCAERGLKVLVSVPRRVLAMTASQSFNTLARASGMNHSASFAIGNREEEDSHPRGSFRNSDVVYATSETVLAAAPLFNESDVIVVDEAHEMGLAVSILLGRLTEAGKKIVVQSATIDLSPLVAFFESHGLKCKEIDIRVERRYPVDFIEVAGRDLLGLVLEQAKTISAGCGMMVFLPGKAACRRLAKKIEEHDENLEVLVISSESSQAELSEFYRSPPALKRRIIIGTASIEAGVNTDYPIEIGISTGRGKTTKFSGLLPILVENDLPQWRVVQQLGRVGRTCPGRFLLLGLMDGRRESDGAEIERQPNLGSVLLSVLQHRQAIRNEEVGEVKLFPSLERQKELLQEALSLLKRLDLIVDGEGSVELSPAGRFAARNPAIDLHEAAAFWQLREEAPSLIPAAITASAAINAAAAGSMINEREVQGELSIAAMLNSNSIEKVSMTESVMLTVSIADQITAGRFRPTGLSQEIGLTASWLKRFREAKFTLEKALGVKGSTNVVDSLAGNPAYLRFLLRAGFRLFSRQKRGYTNYHPDAGGDWRGDNQDQIGQDVLAYWSAREEIFLAWPRKIITRLGTEMSLLSMPIRLEVTHQLVCDLQKEGYRIQDGPYKGQRLLVGNADGRSYYLPQVVLKLEEETEETVSSEENAEEPEEMMTSSTSPLPEVTASVETEEVTEEDTAGEEEENVEEPEVAPPPSTEDAATYTSAEDDVEDTVEEEEPPPPILIGGINIRSAGCDTGLFSEIFPENRPATVATRKKKKKGVKSTSSSPAAERPRVVAADLAALWNNK